MTKKDRHPHLICLCVHGECGGGGGLGKILIDGFRKGKANATVELCVRGNGEGMDGRHWIGYVALLSSCVTVKK